MKRNLSQHKMTQLTARLAGVAVLAAIASTGCGKQEFKVTSAVTQADAPGSYSLAPKVDILMVLDDTGSMYETRGRIARQLPTFLNGLQAKNWNYHYATVPLTQVQTISQVVAGRNDYNWGAEWIAPYPGAFFPAGAPYSNPDYNVLPSLFRRPEAYQMSIQPQSSNGDEPGLATLVDTLNNREPGTGFSRPDAVLAIILIGNGDDTSGITYCNRPADGYSVPCEQLGSDYCKANPGKCTAESSYQRLKNSLIQIKTGVAPAAGTPPTQALKFYAAVSTEPDGEACLGSRAYNGSRYIRMAGDLGGKTYDICKYSVSTILDSLTASLQVQTGSYKTHYLFVGTEPDPTTLVVTKYPGGNTSQGVTLVQSATNGWTYKGFGTDYAIDDPVQMNQQTGYEIELHGNARLSGNDRADVAYKPNGAHDSH